MFFEESGVFFQFLMAPFLIVMEDLLEISEVSWVHSVPFFVSFFLFEADKMVYFVL